MRCQKPTRRRDHAFSLIELTVSIAVIITLAAIAGASVHRAKRRAQAASCVNNLRQQGIWLAQFVGEFDQFPMASNERPDLYPNHATHWAGSLRRMGGFPDVILRGDAGDVFNCPSTRFPVPEAGSSDAYEGYGYNADGIIGSAVNSFIGLGGMGGEKGFGRAPPVKPSAVVNPSEMIASGDSFFGWRTFIIDGRYGSIGLRYGLTPRDGETSRALNRHNGRGQYLFCDGHVDSVPLTKLFFNADTQLGRMWNRDNQTHPERFR
jgi:prepilin-type processing-associated H-X9-DG protein